MQQVGDRGEQRHFLAAVLTGGGGEGRTDLAVQHAALPKPARLVEERGHLGGHPPEPCRRTDDDCIIVFQIGDRGDRRGLVELEIGRLGDLQRRGFRHTLDVDRRAGLSRTGGDGLGHLFDMAVGRIVKNQDLAHWVSP